MPFNLRLHRVRIGADQHRLVGNIEGVHRIKLAELQVVARAAASFGKKFVEEELHHQEGRTEIETVLAEADFGIAAADNILFFEELNTEAALCKEHGSGETARASPNDHDVPFSLCR
jgi:hypothetical protein